MGNRVAPPLAIVFMHAIESLLLATPKHQPLLYLRYIDDIICVWKDGSDALDEYFRFVNDFHPALKFSIERTDKSETGSIPFLDTLLTVRPDGTYSTELYYKPMTAPIIIHYTSAHPIQTKLAVLQSQFLRAKRLGSDRATIDRGTNKVEALFLQNGYPNRVIQRSKFKVIRMDTTHNQDRAKDNVTYVSLPFIDDDLSRRITSKVRKSGLPLRIAWKGGNTTASTLVRSALHPPPCPSGNKVCNACSAGIQGNCTARNVVYRITCLLCEGQTYIGETLRHVRLRFNEHVRNAVNETEQTVFGDHMLQCHHDQKGSISATSFKVEVLRRCKDVAELKIAESKLIRDMRPTLNIQTSSWKLTKPPSFG